MPAALDRTDLRQFDLADPRQVINDLLLLVAELLLVRQYLPFAPPTHAEMFALRLAPHGALLHHAQHPPFHERVLLLRHLYIHDVARHAVRHKHHHAVHFRQRFAFCRHAGNLDMLQYR